mgnify:CR=1 FL=1
MPLEIFSRLLTVYGSPNFFAVPSIHDTYAMTLGLMQGGNPQAGLNRGTFGAGILMVIGHFLVGIAEAQISAAKGQLAGLYIWGDIAYTRGMFFSPDYWRTYFKPTVKAMIELCHQNNLPVIYHGCGNVHSILPDFIEIGVDVLNISQPNVVDVAEVGRQLRGRQCFMMPISYQTVSISGTREEILAEAQRLYDLLATPDGGFIGYVEEYGCMGMSETNYRACGEAFDRLDPSRLAAGRAGCGAGAFGH